MPQSDTGSTSTSRGVRTTLGVVVLLMLGIAGLFIAYSHLPRAASGNSATTSDLITPIAVLTNPVGSLTVNRGADFNGTHITVTRVQEAAAFSDDRKAGGTYTVRVYVHTINSGQAPTGIDYSSQVRLQLPDGQLIAPKLVAIAPVALPNQEQDGFFDFPIASQVELSSLVLRLGNGAMVAFA